jgi:hypothetical protein
MLSQILPYRSANKVLGGSFRIMKKSTLPLTVAPRLREIVNELI